MENITHISAADFVQKISSGESCNILDIRTNLEFENLSLAWDVTHIPLHDIDTENFSDPRDDKNKPLYVLCKMGPRAQKISEILSASGHKNLVVIDGGIIGCCECDCDVKTAENSASQDEIMAAVQDSVQKFMMRCQ